MTILFISTIIILGGCIGYLSFTLWKTQKRNRILEQTLRIKKEKRDTEIANKIRLSKKQLETSFDAISDCLCVIDREASLFFAFFGETASRLPSEFCNTTPDSVSIL